MKTKKIFFEQLQEYREHLVSEEKSTVTIEKYLRDIKAFFKYAGDKEITKELTVSYKKYLQEQNYMIRSINSMIASLNSFFKFMEWEDCKVKSMRFQRPTYSSEERELTKTEYLRLLEASKEEKQTNLIIQTICGTGIRISELKYFTVEAVVKGEIFVRCKNKTRTILISGKLKKRLLDYAKKQKIFKGMIFITRTGKPLDRSNIWKRMKQLCKISNVNEEKVFPHNLRKLFARTFYKIDKDIAKLADILGHGSIETTRIYIMTTGKEHRKKMEQLGLVI